MGTLYHIEPYTTNISNKIPYTNWQTYSHGCQANGIFNIIPPLTNLSGDSTETMEGPI